MAEHAPNVAAWERWASLAAGATLMAAAAPRRRWPAAFALAAGGAAFLERGLTDHCRLYRRIGFASRAACDAGADQCIDLAADHSFPASDPPSWTPTAAGAPRGV